MQNHSFSESEPGHTETPSSHAPRTGLWIGIGLVAAGLIADVCLVYPRLRDYGAQISNLGGLRDTAASLGSRLDRAEEGLSNLPMELRALETKSAAAQQRLAASVEQLRKSTADLRASAMRDVEAALSTERQQVNARFEKLETGQQAQAERTAQLEQQNAQLRRQLSDLNGQLATVHQGLKDELRSVRDSASRDTAQLQDEVRRTDARATRSATLMERPRTRFEATKGRTQEVAPGILLHVDKTDIAYRRYRGWLELVEEGKFVWLRDESMLQPVPFYTKSGTLRHDLVVTSLDSNGVAGYVLFPSKGEMEAAGQNRASLR